MRFGVGVCFSTLMVTFAVAQGPRKPALIVACLNQKASYTPTDIVHLTITIENRGTSRFYLYQPLEWGWTGLWFGLLDGTGNVIRPKQPAIAPLPPPPLHDKSDLVDLEPGYFYGRELNFALRNYHLKPGTYSIAVAYRSNYDADDGFGLPILTRDDGEIVGNKIEFAVR